MAGGFAFQPELVAGAAVEHGVAGFDGLAKGFFVHEADHQDAAGFPVLDDSGYEAVELREIKFHSKILVVQQKSPPESGGLFEIFNSFVFKSEPVAAQYRVNEGGDDAGVRRT